MGDMQKRSFDAYKRASHNQSGVGNVFSMKGIGLGARLGKRLLAAALTLVLAGLCVLEPLGNAETVWADTTATVAYVYTDSDGYHVVPRTDLQQPGKFISPKHSPGAWVYNMDMCIDKRLADEDGRYTGEDPSHFEIPAFIEILSPLYDVPPGYTGNNAAAWPVSSKGEVCAITKIGDYAFYRCIGIRTMNIPYTIDTIGQDAFCECDELESLIIPSNVRNIEAYAFKGCDNLKSVRILGTDIKIGDRAFKDCKNLESITFPDNVTSLDIGVSAFYNCSSLTNIMFPEGMAGIGDYAFAHCDNLTEITIPGSVESIGDMAFYDCPLTDVMISDGVKSIGARAFEGYGTLTNLTIPDSVESIGDFAFGYNELTSITIPKNVSSIGANPGLGTEILLDEKNTHFTLEDRILYDKDKTRLIACPFDKTGSVTIPDSVTEIGDYAFFNCIGLEEIVIPDSVERIGERAFVYCGLTSIRIPEHVSEIGETAFDWCGDLLTITVDEKNEAYSSEDGILYNKDKTRLIACPSGKTGDLAIPQTVTAISSGAFYGTELTMIALPDTMESINSSFGSNDNLFGIIIPDSVTDIEEWIFDDCENLTIYGNEGSYAETFAREHNIPFSTGTPPKTLASCEITVILPSPDDDKTERPTVIVKDGDKTLENGTDYTVQFYRDFAYLEGKGEYVGYVRKYFELPEEPDPVYPGIEISSEVRQKVQELAEECEASGAKNDYEKALWLHDWLIYHADYDEEKTEYGPEGVLLNGKGVCQSYAIAYQLLLDEMGIENDIVVAPEMDHAWNIAKINDSWTHIDCTWDDPILGPCSDETGPMARGGMENHTYFGLGDDEMAKDHVWDHSAYPECFAILRELSKDSLKNPYDLMKPVVGYELSLADASGRTLTRKDFASGNTLLIFGRPTCPNTMWFINEITPWKDVLEQNQVHVIVIFEDEQQVKESAGQIPFTCTYEKDIIKENWEFDARCGLTDPYITFPRVVLQNAQGYAFYYSTGFVNEPERVLATALQKLPVTEDISKTPEPPKKVGDSLTVDGIKYQITSSSKGKKEVSYIRGSKEAAKIKIPAAIPVNGVSYKVTSIANNAFKGCKNLKSITIGKNVTKIGNNAFYKCTSLKKITVPASVTTIGKKAFYGCKNLDSIIIKTQKLKSSSVGAQAFKGIHKKAVIKVPKKQKAAYKKWLTKKGITKIMKIK